jgi:hypothetical protein
VKEEPGGVEDATCVEPLKALTQLRVLLTGLPGSDRGDAIELLQAVSLRLVDRGA